VYKFPSLLFVDVRRSWAYSKRAVVLLSPGLLEEEKKSVYSGQKNLQRDINDLVL
jgi:hypothetical protein